MNKRHLKAVMIAHGDNYKSLSEYLGITVSTFSKKINEKRKAGFTQPEILMIKERYSLTAEEIDTIFLLKKCLKKI